VSEEPTPPQLVEVLAVRGGERWGTVTIALAGGADVGRPLDSLPRQTRTEDPTVVVIAPGVTRTRWRPITWNLAVVPSDGREGYGYAYVFEDDPPHAPELLRRLIFGN
jgi:hypothetical protein